jgi:hypothetical protein
MTLLRGACLLLLLGAGGLGEHVARAEDQQVLAVDGDLGAAVLRVDDDVADREVERDELAAVLGAAAGADASTSPCCGFSLAVSGMTRPLMVVSSASAGRTTIRSSSGCRFIRVASIYGSGSSGCASSGSGG